MNIFTLFHTRWRLQTVESTIRQQEITLNSQDLRANQVETELGRTRLAVEALVELIGEKLGIDREQVVERMIQIDQRDGRLDGKITPLPIACPQCQRPVAANHARCIYCGGDRPTVTEVTGTL